MLQIFKRNFFMNRIFYKGICLLYAFNRWFRHVYVIQLLIANDFENKKIYILGFLHYELHNFLTTFLNFN